MYLFFIFGKYRSCSWTRTAVTDVLNIIAVMFCSFQEGIAQKNGGFLVSFKWERYDFDYPITVREVELSFKCRGVSLIDGFIVVPLTSGKFGGVFLFVHADGFNLGRNTQQLTYKSIDYSLTASHTRFRIVM